MNFVRLILILIVCLLMGYAVNAQTKEQIADQRLSKTLDALEASEKYASALERENASLKRQVQLQDERDQLRVDAIKARDEEIKALRSIKCSKTRFFWGVITVKKCD